MKKQANKYLLDSSGFFEYMKDNGITWLDLSLVSNVYLATISNLKHGKNVRVYTIISLIKGLEEITNKKVNVDKLFKIKDVEKSR